MEEELALSDGEVVFAPVPELPEVLVVQGVERVVPTNTQLITPQPIFFNAKMTGATKYTQWVVILFLKRRNELEREQRWDGSMRSKREV